MCCYETSHCIIVKHQTSRIAKKDALTGAAAVRKILERILASCQTKLEFIMKTSLTTFVLFCAACTARTDFDEAKGVISRVIDDEERFAASGDTAGWSSCWVAGHDAILTRTSADGVEQFSGTDHILAARLNTKSVDQEAVRNNFRYSIGDGVAFVSFDQASSARKTSHTRTLRMEEGRWQIVNSMVIDVSSFARKGMPIHIGKEDLPVGMKAPGTVMRSQSGFGGMAVAFNEVPSGGDMTPLFEGLPNNACPAPHWGYILEGSIRLKYIDGTEETVNAGEVFYWPPGHVPFVEKNLKIIDFTPENDFRILMDHLALKMQGTGDK